jgi:hypothetical protein
MFCPLPAGHPLALGLGSVAGPPGTGVEASSTDASATGTGMLPLKRVVSTAEEDIKVKMEEGDDERHDSDTASEADEDAAATRTTKGAGSCLWFSFKLLP